jgi:hypothetical protein
MRWRYLYYETITKFYNKTHCTKHPFQLISESHLTKCLQVDSFNARVLYRLIKLEYLVSTQDKGAEAGVESTNVYVGKHFTWQHVKLEPKSQRCFSTSTGGGDTYGKTFCQHANVRVARCDE